MVDHRAPPLCFYIHFGLLTCCRSVDDACYISTCWPLKLIARILFINADNMLFSIFNAYLNAMFGTLGRHLGSALLRVICAFFFFARQRD